MTDYHPLIARAVEGLGKSTGEARRALYERARTALVAQLRSVEPALSESEITKERLALEEAIRKVEADAARKSRMEARTEPRFEPRPLKPPVGRLPPQCRRRRHRRRGAARLPPRRAARRRSPSRRTKTSRRSRRTSSTSRRTPNRRRRRRRTADAVHARAAGC